MSRAFLFPADFSHPSRVDEMFEDQFLALKAAGYPCAVIDLDDSPPMIRGAALEGHTVVYRGWMLGPDNYTLMVDAIYAAKGTPAVSLGEYLSCHYLPNWYPHIKELTAETQIFPPPSRCDIETEIRNLGWGWVFIKDYVKSNKTGRGAVARTPDVAPRIVAEMLLFRGPIEGGLCVRRYEDLSNEKRVFVVGGRVCHNLDPVADVAYLDLANQVSKRNISSPFYSIDIATRADGVLRVVEIGDGQVSDLVGWTPEQFAAIWK